MRKKESYLNNPLIDQAESISDISDRNQAENALREREALFRMIFETLSEGVALNEIIYDEQGEMVDYRILIVNPAFYDSARLNGEVVGKLATELYGLPMEYIKEFWRTHKEKDSIQYTELVSPNGIDVFIVATSPFKNDLFVTTFFEITELKRMEKQLTASEEKHRTYIEHAPLGIFVVDGKGHYVDVNPGACKLLGYSKKELLELSIPDIAVNVEDARSFAQLKKEGKLSFDMEIKKKDGSAASVRLDAIALPNDQFIAFCTDISERKTFIHEIQKERDQAQNYLDIAEVLIMALNTKGIITLMNTYGNQILGYENSNLIGMNWFETCIPEGRRKEVRKVFDEIMAGNKDTFKVFENPILTKTGEERIISWHNAVLKDQDGNHIGILSSGEDITERRRSEKLLTALNQASYGLGKAVTHQSIFDTIASNLNELNISSMLFLVDESQTMLLASFLSFEAKSLEAIEKLVKIKRKNFAIPIEASELYEGVIKKRKTIFSDESDKIMEKALPDFAKKYASRIIKLLKIQNSITSPVIANDQVIGLFSIQSNSLTKNDIEITKEFANKLSSGWEKITLIDNLNNSLEGIIHTVAKTVEARDPYTAGHQHRVSALSAAIAREMGLTDNQIKGIKMAGIIHDLGKINVPAEILSKPGKITTLEFELIKTHPQIGYELLKGIEFPWPIACIVLQHHEKMDGSGYPQGLKGDEIMLEARILSVADTVEAMASHRPYRSALGIDKAIAQIKQDSGMLFDANVVDACMNIFAKGFAFPSID